METVGHSGWGVVVYVVSWLVVMVLAYFPPRRLPAVRDRAVVFWSLPAMVLVGFFRGELTGDATWWIPWVATSLNVGILLGTRFDPVTAVAYVDSIRARDDPRTYRAWPSLLIFVTLAGAELLAYRFAT
ncbi:MAG TPA: hypothetical protein VNR17_11215 [Luteimicrobium sp.]|nr:hypothetical protein [Luteimicrobium sp.]